MLMILIEEKVEIAILSGSLHSGIYFSPSFRFDNLFQKSSERKHSFIKNNWLHSVYLLPGFYRQQIPPPLLEALPSWYVVVQLYTVVVYSLLRREDALVSQTNLHFKNETLILPASRNGDWLTVLS